MKNPLDTHEANECYDGPFECSSRGCDSWDTDPDCENPEDALCRQCWYEAEAADAADRAYDMRYDY